MCFYRRVSLLFALAEYVCGSFFNERARTEIKNDFLFILASALRARTSLARVQQQHSHCCTLQLRLIYAFRARPTRSLAKVGAAQPRALPLWQTNSAAS
jgi:hypothetical protein